MVRSCPIAQIRYSTLDCPFQKDWNQESVWQHQHFFGSVLIGLFCHLLPTQTQDTSGHGHQLEVTGALVAAHSQECPIPEDVEKGTGTQDSFDNGMLPARGHGLGREGPCGGEVACKF